MLLYGNENVNLNHIYVYETNHCISHHSEWLSRLNHSGVLLVIGSEEKPLLLTENGEPIRVMVTPPNRKWGTNQSDGNAS